MPQQQARQPFFRQGRLPLVPHYKYEDEEEAILLLFSAAQALSSGLELE